MESAGLLGNCRREYSRLAGQLQRDGLDRAEIEHSRWELADPHTGGYWLKREAYLPTGVALGCPLPPKITRTLASGSRLIEKWLAQRTGATHPAFICVPQDQCHITVVNRTHYEFSPQYRPLTATEMCAVADVLRHLSVGVITVLTTGLLLTHGGKLFVKCLPVDYSILTIRDALVDQFPLLRVNVPRIIHMKLGHLAVYLSPDEIDQFLSWLVRIEQDVIARVQFTDVFTPAGRIDL